MARLPPGARTVRESSAHPSGRRVHWKGDFANNPKSGTIERTENGYAHVRWDDNTTSVVPEAIFKTPRWELHEAQAVEGASLYDKLKAEGQQLDHHESDLYVKWTPEADAIIKAHGGPEAANARPFTSQIDGKRWIDIPFAYTPWWGKRQQRTREAHRSGRVSAPKRLDAFTRQYMETALWSSTDNSRDDGGDPLDKNYSVEDIAPETRDKMIADCADFQERFGHLYDDSEQAGHDFWLSRNGHGTGFFDRDTPNADELQDAAKSYGEFDLYVGDDGMIYGSGG